MNKKHIAALVALASIAALLVLLTGSLGGRKSLLAETLSAAAGSKAGSITQAENQALSAPRQLRAVWIATAWNIDWPSSQGLSAAKQQHEFIAMLDEAKNVGMNAVIVQVKPNADSLYPSEYGPWSDILTGRQGQSPGYDPLAFMVEEAHKRNLEFHAWFNPYRIGKTKDAGKLAADHPALRHPDWVASYAGTQYYNPGIPEVRDFVAAGITEVVRKYDIDAVHLDDYFYPYPEKGKDFPDDSAYQKYGKSKFGSKPHWRRDNVNRLVEAIHAAIKKEKPYVKFGISPFGVWRNQNADPTGSETTAGTTNYDTLFADTRAWINAGWVDYIAPQLYWNFGFKPAAYDKLADWWIKETEGKPVQLYIGHAPFKIGQQDPPGWRNPDELPDQLKFNARSAGKISGSILFSLKDIRRNPLGFRDRLNTELYASPALVPPMPWLGSAAPQPPKALSAESTPDGVRLDWRDGGGNPAYYAVYRAEGSGSEAARLIGTVRRGGSGPQTFTDRAAPAGKPLRYVVTALDRLHNESTTSRTASADVPGRFAKAK